MQFISISLSTKKKKKKKKSFLTDRMDTQFSLVITSFTNFSFEFVSENHTYIINTLAVNQLSLKIYN
jgi:hypothetical protein